MRRSARLRGRKRIWYMGAWLSLGLGIVGAFLPVMPTVPFIVLAAFCYSRSSKAHHRWLRQHRLFGASLRNWEDRRTVPLKVKLLASVLALSGLTISLYFLEFPRLLSLVSYGLVLAVLTYIWIQKSE